ncbi:MAG: urease accessory protein UreE [Rhodobacteraceae bacterium]|nr:urease accessory protein UreE [Paracoccaceae bacterium]
MTDLPHAHRIRRACQTEPLADSVTLGYDARFLRRRVLDTATGASFLADLPETTSLDAGDAFELDDGRLIGVIAAQEPLIEVRGDLARLAWHIGNRHTPCRIEADRLLIRQDHVLAGMLTGLGAAIREVVEPFTPEGGAYGPGRTLGHDHGPDHAHPHVHHHASHTHDEEPEEDEGDPEVVR